MLYLYMFKSIIFVNVTVFCNKNLTRSTYRFHSYSTVLYDAIRYRSLTWTQKLSVIS